MTGISFLLWSSAFIAGLLGSGHCLGMCGGIATALGSIAPAALPRSWWVVLFHSGRILSYSTFGALAGALGAAGLGLSGEGAYLRLGTAALIVLMGLNLVLGGAAGARWLRAPERFGAWLWRRLQPLAVVRLPNRPIPRALLSGALWGWLPCGLVYSALLVAITAGSATGGAATMLGFGLGTVPAMAGIGALASRLPALASPRSRWLGLIVIGCGVWTAALPARALVGAPPNCAHLPQVEAP